MIGCLGELCWVSCAVRFSPNWLELCCLGATSRERLASDATPSRRAARVHARRAQTLRWTRPRVRTVLRQNLRPPGSVLVARATRIYNIGI